MVQCICHVYVLFNMALSFFPTKKLFPTVCTIFLSSRMEQVLESLQAKCYVYPDVLSIKPFIRMRISVWVSAGLESTRRIPRTVLQRGPLKSGLRGDLWRNWDWKQMLARKSHRGGGEVSENSQAWVFTFWALPLSTNNRTSAAHWKGVRSIPIGREADCGRREQMSWERRANSQTKPSKREVKTFDPEQSLCSASSTYMHTCTQHTVFFYSTGL